VNANRSISPPDLTADLRELLRDRYPAADRAVISSAAFIIDGQISCLLRLQRTIKITGKPRHWPKQYVRDRQCPIRWSRIPRRGIANELRRLGRAVKSKSEWVWAKTWHELSPEVVGLLDEVAGTEGIWANVPKHPPLHPVWERVIAKVSAKYGVTTTMHDASAAGTNFAQNLFGAAIPSPRTIAPLIPVAIRRAGRTGRPANWRRDMAVAELARQFERLTGEQPRQASKEGLGLRSGSFPDFLDRLEKFYNDRLPKEFRPLKFGVQRSGRNMSRIFGGPSR
jgi:hypothetical protein